METEAVIFDLDGTLFDHQGAARDGAAAWLAALGHAPDENLLDHWFALEEAKLTDYGLRTAGCRP